MTTPAQQRQLDAFNEGVSNLQTNEVYEAKASAITEIVDQQSNTKANERADFEQNDNTAVNRLGATVNIGSISGGIALDILMGYHDMYPREADFQQFYWANRADIERGYDDSQVELLRGASSRAELRALQQRFANQEAGGRLLADQNMLEALGMGLVVFGGDPAGMGMGGGIARLPRYAARFAGAGAAVARSAEHGVMQGLSFAALQGQVTTNDIGLSQAAMYAAFGAVFGVAGYKGNLDKTLGQPAPEAPVVPPAAAPQQAPVPVPTTPTVSPVAAKVLAGKPQVTAPKGTAAVDAQVAQLKKAAAKAKKNGDTQRAKELKAEAAKIQKEGVAAVVPKEPVVKVTEGTTDRKAYEDSVDAELAALPDNGEALIAKMFEDARKSDSPMLALGKVGLYKEAFLRVTGRNHGEVREVKQVHEEAIAPEAVLRVTHDEATGTSTLEADPDNVFVGAVKELSPEPLTPAVVSTPVPIPVTDFVAKAKADRKAKMEAMPDKGASMIAELEVKLAAEKDPATKRGYERTLNGYKESYRELTGEAAPVPKVDMVNDQLNIDVTPQETAQKLVVAAKTVQAETMEKLAARGVDGNDKAAIKQGIKEVQAEELAQIKAAEELVDPAPSIFPEVEESAVVAEAPKVEAAPEAPKEPAVNPQDGRVMFDPEVVERATKQSYGSRDKVVTMPIKDFLAMAEPGHEPAKQAAVKALADSGTKFYDLPDLSIEVSNGVAKVVGHEGRHRARELLARGYTHMPVVFRSRAPEGGSSIRWQKQTKDHEGTFDYFSEEWPTRMEAQKSSEQIPFQFTREQAAAWDNGLPVEGAPVAPTAVKVKSVSIGQGSDRFIPDVLEPAIAAAGAGNATKLVGKSGKEYQIVTLADEFDDAAGRVLVVQNGKLAGDLDYIKEEMPDGTRYNPGVWVDPEFRRDGVATAMYAEAERNGGKIPALDQKGQVRTTEGQAFREGMARKQASKDAPTEVHVATKEDVPTPAELTAPATVEASIVIDAPVVTPAERAVKRVRKAKLPKAPVPERKPTEAELATPEVQAAAKEVYKELDTHPAYKDTPEPEFVAAVEAIAAEKVAIAKADKVVEEHLQDALDTGSMHAGLRVIAEQSADPVYKVLAKRLLDILPDVKVVVIKATDDLKAVFGKDTGSLKIWKSGSKALHTVSAEHGEVVYFMEGHKRAGEPGVKQEEALHEFLHVATAERIVAAEKSGNKELIAAVEELKTIYRRVQEVYPSRSQEYKELQATIGGNLLANPRELVSWGLTNARFRELLSEIPMLGDAPTPTSAWSKFVRAIRSLLGLPEAVSDTALGRLIVATDRIMSQPTPENSPFRAAPQELTNPMAIAAHNNIDLIPDAAQQAMVKNLYEVVAPKWLKDNPIDIEKLTKVLNFAPRFRSLAIGGLTSPNDVLRGLIAATCEVTTGAAGRNNRSPAIQKTMKYQKYMGHLGRVEGIYDAFKASSGKGWIRNTFNEMFDGGIRKQWDDALSAEQDWKWQHKGQSHPASSPHIIAAGKELDEGFRVMAQDAVDHGVEGADNIDVGRPGYTTHTLDSKAIMEAPDEVRIELARAVAGDLKVLWGNDAKAEQWADEIGMMYLEHALNRAHGFVPIRSLTSTAEKSVLQGLILNHIGAKNPDLALELISKLSVKAMKQSQTRLNIDMFKTFSLRNGKQMMIRDLFVKNTSVLYRQYSHRVSGEVALSYAGIKGVGALDQIKFAISRAPDGQRGSPEQQAADLRTFDQLAAEFLGRPYGSHNLYVDNLVALTSLNRLGAAVFPQLGETHNIIAHHGVGVFGKKYLPNAMKLLKGVKFADKQASFDPVLSGFEEVGGIFGYNYHVAFPFEPMNTISGIDHVELGAFTRTLTAAGMGARWLSGYHATYTSQTRGAALATVHTSVGAAKHYMATGEIHPLTRDMGFDEAMLTRIHNLLPSIAKFDTDGSLISLDLRNVDAAFVEEWTVAVTRGASQTIQSTHVGERSDAAHHSWGRMLTQFRGIGITGMEKQAARQHNALGSVRFTGYLLGAMAWAIPLYLLRVNLNAVGLSSEEREKLYARSLSPLAISRAVLTYTTMTGYTSDMYDLLLTTGAAATMGVESSSEHGTVGRDILAKLGKPSVGGSLVDTAVPAVGYMNSYAKGVAGLARRDSEGEWNPDMYRFWREQPAGRILPFIPLVNYGLSPDDDE